MKLPIRIGLISAFLALPLATFAQSGYITRAEFVVNMMASKGLYGTGGNCFPDVTNQAFAPAVCEAKARGFVRGEGSGRFNPQKPVSLIDAAVMAMRVERVSLPSDAIWYRPAIEKLAEWNAIPDSINSIVEPLSVSQANEVLVSVRNRGDDDDHNDDDDDDDVEHDDDDDDLTVSITESDASPDAGDTVTYRIRIVNDDNDDVDVDVRAELDSDMTFVSASQNGDDDDDVVEWEDVEIDADDDITLSLTVRINNNADDTVKLRVEVDDEVDEEETDVDNNNNDDDDDDDDDNNNDGDISLSIDDSNDPIRAGGTVTYRIRLQNDGNSDERIDVRADLDRDMTFISATEDGEDDDDVVEWNNVDVDEDDTTTLLLTVRADAGLDDGDTIRLRVRAGDETETEDTEIDRDGSNDRNDDVEISISDVEDPVEEGEVVTYRIVVTNNENNPVRVSVNAFLDEETSFVSASDNGDLHGDDEVNWEDVDVARDSSKTLLLTVRPRSTVRDGDTVRVRVEAEDDEDDETTRIEQSNDTDEDIRISITDSEDPAAPGDSVTYRILLENRGNRDESIDVRARLDADMSFSSANNGGDLNGNEVRWDNVDIDEGDDLLLTVTVRIRTSADDGDTVRFDVQAGNEDDTETTRIRD